MSARFEVIEVAQGTPEWFAMRAGLVTGSNASAVMAGDTTAARADYRLRLAVERLTGTPQTDDFTNKHMQHGQEMEPMARLAVEMRHRIVVRQTGFLRSLVQPIGVSLDGDWQDFRYILELKCPKPTTHIGYMQAGKVPAVYRWQFTHGLYVTGAEGGIFASYDERLPEGLELFSLEVRAQDMPLEEYEKGLQRFLAEVDAEHEKLINLRKKNSHGRN